MRKISKIVASAMALALTATMVAPLSVNAMNDVNYSGTPTATGELDTTKPYTVTETNKETGKTYSWSYDGTKSTYNSSERSDALRFYVGTPSKINVGIDDYYNLSIALEYGETLSSIKVAKKGKGNITLKKSGESMGTAYPSHDSATKTYYFPKRDGSKAVVPTLTDANYTDDLYYSLQKTRYSYTFRIGGKNIGTSTIEYSVKDETGKVTKKKVKVNVTDDSRIFKSVKYAGKELIYNYAKGANNSNYIYSGSRNKGGYDYTTKKAGKFKVTPNKDYRVVSIWVEKDNPYETAPDSNNYDDEYATRTGTTTRNTKTPVDLNGDGDCFDTIDGLSEDSTSTSNFTKLKNGKKLTLSKVASKSGSTYDYQSKKSQYNSHSKSSSESNIAGTTVHIIYQNKITKAYGRTAFYISLRTSKK